MGLQVFRWVTDPVDKVFLPLQYRTRSGRFRENYTGTAEGEVPIPPGFHGRIQGCLYDTGVITPLNSGPMVTTMKINKTPNCRLLTRTICRGASNCAGRRWQEVALAFQCKEAGQRALSKARWMRGTGSGGGVAEV